MIAIVDYGVGNLFSLECSFNAIGADTVITGDKEVIKKCDKIILPGVGAFSDAIAKLKSSGLAEVVINQAKLGKPILGICLGMQLLFEKSYEYGEYEGLGLIKGEIRPIGDVAPDVKVPHIGWNTLDFVGDVPPIFKYIKDGSYVYFVHSFYGAECDSVCATTDYGAKLTAAVAKGNIFGCQFHPEKSGDVGLNILRGFCDYEEGTK